MSVEHIEFAALASGLSISPLPVWVVEAGSYSVCWANDAALELWDAEERSELFARDMNRGVPERVSIRTEQLFAQLREGKLLREEWTFYPRGRARTVVLCMRATIRPEGGLGYLFQALPVVPEASEDLLRTITISRYAAVMVAFIDSSAQLISQNSAAKVAFGERRSWRSWLVDELLADQIIADALAGARVRMQVRVRSEEGLRWHGIEAQSLRDPVTSTLGVLIEHRDETARIEAEQLAERRAGDIDTLTATLELVQRQRREILALSAPLLDVGEQTLAVPIIGRLNETLSGEIVAKLLASVTQRRVNAVILDLTGVVEVNAEGAARLAHLVAALSLLGSTARIAGIRPETAEQLLDAGIDLAEVEIVRSLAEGLRMSKKKG